MPIGHTLFSNDRGKLDELIDWPLMEQWRSPPDLWHNSASFPDRKERRQAEFLVHHAVPWTAVSAIGVINDTVATQVQRAIAVAEYQPIITCTPQWYY